jgi:predicted permease
VAIPTDQEDQWFGISRSSFGLDWGAALFAALLSVVTVNAVAVIPALRLRTLDISPAFRLQRAAGAGRRLTAASALVVAQVTFAVVVVVVGALLARDLRDLQTVDLGFRTDSVVTAEISLDPQYRGNTARDAFLRFVAGARRLPGVASAALTNASPQAPHYMGTQVAVSGEGEDWVWLKVITEAYFSALCIPFLAGRDFSQDDGPNDGPPTAVVSRSLAEKYWGAPSAAVGNILRRDGVPHLVIGVVADARDGGERESHSRRVYVSYRQHKRPFTHMVLLLRFRGVPPGGWGERLTQLVRQTMADHPLYNLLPLEHIVNAKLASARMISRMMTLFALLALCVAGLGVHGALSCSVTARTHEIGIRRAIGGPDQLILTQIVAEGMRLVAVGGLLGLVAALGLRSLVTSQLLGGARMEPMTCALALGVVGAAGLVASVGPARRAIRIDPIEALRDQ